MFQTSAGFLTWRSGSSCLAKYNVRVQSSQARPGAFKVAVAVARGGTGKEKLGSATSLDSIIIQNHQPYRSESNKQAAATHCIRCLWSGSYMRLFRRTSYSPHRAPEVYINEYTPPHEPSATSVKIFYLFSPPAIHRLHTPRAPACRSVSSVHRLLIYRSEHECLLESSAVSPSTSAAIGPGEMLDVVPYRLPASTLVARPSGA